nr:RNA-directed DNA polymerase, eukaryota [Tanacetum cinerariifolium]
MGSYRSKEDDIARISISIFVTNFPETFSAKDLFHICKQYGHVVDSFIPTKRSKAGKRFGFVRFINVFNNERLVNNLCMIWNNRLKLHANIARFQRNNGNVKNPALTNGSEGKNVNTHGQVKVNMSKEPCNSYVEALKGQSQSYSKATELSPLLVLDDECLASKDLTKGLFGRVKVFSSLANLKMALSNEGFADIKVQYLGELWVLMKFASLDSIKLFHDNVSVGSWFSQIKQASMEFMTEGRITCVEVEGILFKPWSGNTFKRFASKWGQLLDIVDQEDVCFYSKRLCIHSKIMRSINEDFKIIFRGKNGDEGNKEGQNNFDTVSNDHVRDEEEIPETVFVDTGDKHCNVVDKPTHHRNDENVVNANEWNGEKVDNDDSGRCSKENGQTDASESVCLGHFKKFEVPRTGVSILNLFDEVVKVGQVMGYKMDGCIVEVHLGGCAFTWCHKSATKMSKLERFLVLESLLSLCPNLNAVTLERYLSDHRPILLRESNVDYGATPFRFFHHWMEMEGFCKFVEDVWKGYSCDESNAAKLIKDLADVDAIIDSGNGNEVVVNERMGVINDLHNVDKLHSVEMAQKAKIRWAIEGDENSSYFQGLINKKRSILNIRGIMEERRWINDPKNVKREFYSHFSQRFGRPDGRLVTVHTRYPNVLTLEQQMELESIVSNEEIKRSVWDCGIDKASGPDGFTFGFYRRPISLIGSLYKIIAKIMANRLAGVLGDLVHAVQLAFIADRQILDGPLILNEVLQWCKNKRKYALVFKVDFEKTPTDEFQFFKGLKQGDPLSPFLFILIMESLHLLFDRVVKAGMFKGIQLSSSVNISHMFFANDAVFVGKWCDTNINTLTHVLECFHRASGLRINMCKSKIMGINIDNNKVIAAARKLGCLILKPPFLYLGSIVGGSMSQVLAWKEVVDRVKNRLSKWKMKTLSIGGRLTLLKSALGSMSIYHMSIFKAPMSVIHMLESIRSHFFNGQALNSKKSSWQSLDCSFRRVPRGGIELEQFINLKALVQNVILASMEDRWKWDLESSCDFSVASIRKRIDDITLLEVNSKSRWIKYVPIKVNVHVWKVKNDALPSRFNISRRGIVINSIMCEICHNGVETVTHLFFSCCLVREVTCLICRWWDMPFEEFMSYEDWLEWILRLRLPAKNKMMFEGVFYVLWWHGWAFRNKLLFDVKDPCCLLNDYEDVGKLKAKGDIGVFVGYSKESAAFGIYNKRTRKIHESVNVNFDEISEMASKQFSLELGLSNLKETGKSSNPSVSQVSETSKKDLEDLFQDFYDEYFDSSKIMKSSTTNVETSINEEVFHEVSKSFQGESSSSSDMYDSWKSRMELYMLNRPHGRMILESVEQGLLIWPSMEVEGVTRLKKYSKLSAAEAIQADCDVKATNIILQGLPPIQLSAAEAIQADYDVKTTNIILQGLPPEVYALVSTHKVAKELWERIQMLMQGTSLTKQERECKLYDAFDKFAYQKGETLRDFYLKFSLLLNDMNMYNMELEQFQVNTKFLSTLPSEWSKFVTDVKLVRDLHTTNVDQLHAYLGQHEYHANGV